MEDTSSQNCLKIEGFFCYNTDKSIGPSMLIQGTYIWYCWYLDHMEDNVRIYKRTNVYESGPYYSAGYCDQWSSFTIYFIVLFSTTETVGFGQHQ